MLLKRYGYEVSGKEVVEDIHPLAHMKIMSLGDKVSYEGEILAEDAEQARQRVLERHPLVKPWPIIWELNKSTVTWLREKFGFNVAEMLS